MKNETKMSSPGQFRKFDIHKTFGEQHLLHS